MGEGFESRLLSLSQAIDSETEENCRTRVESAHKIAQDQAGMSIYYLMCREKDSE
jgi:hypothetical protein